LDLHSENLLINTGIGEIKYFDFDFSTMKNVISFKDSRANKLIFNPLPNEIDIEKYFNQYKNKEINNSKLLNIQNDFINLILDERKIIYKKEILSISKSLGYVYDLIRVCNWLKNTEIYKISDSFFDKVPDIFYKIYILINLFPVGKPSTMWEQKAITSILITIYLKNTKLI
jgi:hypothetical protein